ncbi:DNA integrity scanning protein DisA nucleotide-binding domain protein [Candidatus Woesearchaeota archaeon]|nr:DNA integrity scanning protein DisA nucleotide-binding domain protein [Candidatus Woesearchaeota archaeon]
MSIKQGRRKIVLRVDEDYDSLMSYKAPSLGKVEEERNKVIPSYVMEAVRSAFQKKLSNFFDARLQKEPVPEVSVSPEPPVLKEERAEQPEPESFVSEELARLETVSQALNMEKLIGTAAVTLSRDLKANCIVTIEKGEVIEEGLGFDSIKVVIFKQAKSGNYQRTISYNTQIKKQQVGSVLPVKELLMEAVNKKCIEKGDKIVFAGGESMGTWLKGFFFVLDVDKVFFNISTHHLTENINADVIESVIGIAQEIGAEGREGRSIGTAFVIGLRDELMKYSKPLLKMNPFAGLVEESRKVTDPEIKETVKNLAQLDGVFLIDEKGTILTAGTYINIDQNNLELPGLQGFGTRHRCTAALTKLTGAIGVVVSASGGTVRIFKDGRIVMKLP